MYKMSKSALVFPPHHHHTQHTPRTCKVIPVVEQTHLRLCLDRTKTSLSNTSFTTQTFSPKLSITWSFRTTLSKSLSEPSATMPFILESANSSLCSTHSSHQKNHRNSIMPLKNLWGSKKSSNKDSSSRHSSSATSNLERALSGLSLNSNDSSPKSPSSPFAAFSAPTRRPGKSLTFPSISKILQLTSPQQIHQQ